MIVSDIIYLSHYRDGAVAAARARGVRLLDRQCGAVAHGEVSQPLRYEY